jgi:hypothetical protein
VSGRVRADGSTVEIAIPNATSWGAAVPSHYYEIRVTGILPPEALLDYERLSADVEPAGTVLHGQPGPPAVQEAGRQPIAK